MTDISTAPRDGAFLVATDDGRVAIVEPHRYGNGWAYEQPQGVMGPIRRNATPSALGSADKITHWMPLPSPPEAGE
jgi:hypothetical protein